MNAFLEAAPPAPGPAPQTAAAPPPPQQQQSAPPSASAGTEAPMPPPPSHQEVVASLRHFQAIERELAGLLRDPDCGRADMRSAIIDATTKLVSNGVMTAGQAVDQLGSVPERPFDQRRWLENHLSQTVRSASLILTHHRMAFAGKNVDTSTPNPDDHTRMILHLSAKYRGKPSA